MGFLDGLESGLRGLSMQVDPAYKQQVYARRNAEYERRIAEEEAKAEGERIKAAIGQRAQEQVTAPYQQSEAEMFPGEMPISGLENITQEAQDATGFQKLIDPASKLSAYSQLQGALAGSKPGNKQAYSMMGGGQTSALAQEGQTARNEADNTRALATNAATNQAAMARQQQEQRFKLANPSLRPESRTAAERNAALLQELMAKAQASGSKEDAQRVDDLRIILNLNAIKKQKFDLQNKLIKEQAEADASGTVIGQDIEEQKIADRTAKRNYYTASKDSERVWESFNKLDNKWMTMGYVQDKFPDLASDTQVLRTRVNNLSMNRLKLLGANPTEGERAFILGLTARLDANPGAFEQLMKDFDERSTELLLSRGIDPNTIETGKTGPKQVNWSDM